MKQRVFIGLLFAGLGVWMVFRNAWVTPGLMLLGVSNLALPIAVWRGVVAGREALAALILFFGVGYLGLTYLLALLAGMPTTVAFWVAFGAALIVAAPIVWLAQRVFVPRKAVG
jgi:hypothetical protein